MIHRPIELARLRRSLARSRIVAILGPRQCGKTTLAREFVDPESVNYFDLEAPQSLARLDEPETALAGLSGLVVIDEIQRRPDLFPVLRVLADRQPLKARFLLLGSAAPELLRQRSESLAGRIEYVLMEGFRLSDVPPTSQSTHWLRGGFPLSFQAASEEDSLEWRKQFLRTFLERDIPQLGFAIPSTALFRFWTMVAHYHGQIWNGAELARSLDVSQPTVRKYLDLMTGVLMVRQLHPWHANVGKRQIKSPKVYIRDSGMLHALLGIRTEVDLQLHPKVGASWEGYAMEEVIKAISPDESYFWGTHGGAELDLLMVKEGRRLGVEFKRMDAPRMTASLRTTITELALDKVFVVYPGELRYAITDKIEAVPLSDFVRGDSF